MDIETERHEKTLEKLKRFHDLCKPLVEYMQENYTPHDQLVITDSRATIFKGDMDTPIPLKWKQKDI